MINAVNPISDVLACVGLQGYEPTLRIALHCESLNTLLYLGDGDLQKTNMKPAHRKKLLLWTAFLRRYIERTTEELLSPDLQLVNPTDSAVHRRAPTEEVEHRSRFVPSGDNLSEKRGLSPSKSVRQPRAAGVTTPRGGKQETSDLSKVRLCTMFTEGTCQYGARCKFAHAKVPLVL